MLTKASLTQNSYTGEEETDVKFKQDAPNCAETSYLILEQKRTPLIDMI